MNRSKRPYSRSSTYLRDARSKTSDPCDLWWWREYNEFKEDTLCDEAEMRRQGMDPDFDWGSNHFRAAKAIKGTVNAALSGESRDNLVFFTLTFRKFPQGQSPFQYANTCFKKAWRGLLSRHFEHYVYVLDVDKAGRPHIHGITFSRQPTRTGFDPDGYDLYMLASKEKHSIKEMRELRSGVSSNSHLRLIWKDLDKNLQRYGFGPMHGVFPFREETPGAGGSKAAWYLVRAYRRAVPRIKKGRVKRVRAYQISKNFPSKKRASDMTSPRWIAASARLRELLSFENHQCFKDLIGERWGLFLNRLIEALDSAFGLNPRGQGWREYYLGSGGWLATRMLFVIESDNYLHWPLASFIPLLKAKAEGYVSHRDEPPKGFFVPVYPRRAAPHPSLDATLERHGANQIAGSEGADDLIRAEPAQGNQESVCRREAEAPAVIIMREGERSEPEPHHDDNGLYTLLVPAGEAGLNLPLPLSSRSQISTPNQNSPYRRPPEDPSPLAPPVLIS